MAVNKIHYFKVKVGEMFVKSITSDNVSFSRAEFMAYKFEQSDYKADDFKKCMLAVKRQLEDDFGQGKVTFIEYTEEYRHNQKVVDIEEVL